MTTATTRTSSKRHCTSCAEPMPAEAAFCGECGAPQAALEVVKPPRTRSRAKSDEQVQAEPGTERPPRSGKSRSTAPGDETSAPRRGSKPRQPRGAAAAPTTEAEENATPIARIPVARRPLQVEASPEQEPEMPVRTALLPVPVPPRERPTAAAPLVSAPRPALPRRRWRLLATLVVVLMMLASVAVLALNDKGTHDRLARSRAAFVISQSTLHTTQSSLATTQSDLKQAQASLAATKEALTAKQQELAGVRNNLSDVKESLNIKSSQIESLKSCLSGVSIALNDAAYGDYSAAVSALQAVDVSCKAAYALF